MTFQANRTRRLDDLPIRGLVITLGLGLAFGLGCYRDPGPGPSAEVARELPNGGSVTPGSVTPGSGQDEAKTPSSEAESEDAAESQHDTVSEDASASQHETESRNVKRLFDGETLNGWEVTDFAGHGDVSVEQGRIVFGFGHPMTGVTWNGDFPSTDYEVRLEAMRVDGIDFFCAMTFRVGDAPCTLVVGGWAGTVVGLSNIDHMDASDNETTQYIRFEKGRWYVIRLRVTQQKIEAWIDDEQVVTVPRANRSFSIRSEVDLSQPFGIASYQTKAALRNIALRSVTSPEED